MSQMALDYQAINLSQGYPDFNCPQALVDRVTYHMNAGHNQYPPMAGVVRLREQIARKTESLYGRKLSPDNEITVTSGATESLFVAIQAVVGSGDEVIVFDPAYDSYEPAVTLAGGKTIHVALEGQDFHINWQQFEDRVSDKTKLVILNSPHNPTGSVISAQDLDVLGEIVGKHAGLFVLSDEVYEHMVFDGIKHTTVLGHDELFERSFVVSSFGKTYHATGWKVAYTIAPAQLTHEFRKIHQFVTFTTVTPIQHALADFLASDPQHYLQLADFYQSKRDLFVAALKKSRFHISPSPGTFFQLAEYGDISHQPDTEFVEYLTKEVGVAAIPISVFYASPPSANVVRFCFAKDDETLQRAASLLCEL